MNVKLLAAFAGLTLLTACGGHNNENAGAVTGGGGSGMASNGIVPGSQEDLAANVGDRVFFDTDRNTLNAEAKSTLDRQSDWLQRYPQVSVQIAGNCDERGTEEYNLALGSRRANAARDYLAARNVSTARITTISYGKDRPTATGSDPQALGQNRNAITSVR